MSVIQTANLTNLSGIYPISPLSPGGDKVSIRGPTFILPTEFRRLVKRRTTDTNGNTPSIADEAEAWLATQGAAASSLATV